MPDDDPKCFIRSQKTKEVIAPDKTSMEAGDQMLESTNYVVFMLITKPQSYQEVMHHEDMNSWLEAMVMEMESQQKAGTFIEVPRPKGENIRMPMGLHLQNCCRWCEKEIQLGQPLSLLKDTMLRTPM